MNIKKYLVFVLLFIVLSKNTCAQTFTNGELDAGPCTSCFPMGWTDVPFTDPVCNASGPAQATSDICDVTGPNLPGGINGNPFSGTAMVSGLHASDGVLIWHEGIKQTVNGFTIGQSYSICFYQAVVKQQNCLDESGSWNVYVDGLLIATTAPSTSSLIFNSNALTWDLRTVNFTATAATHTIKFLPVDDDPNIITSMMDITGALRMGLDLVSFSTPVNPTITAAGPFCDNDAPINLTAADPGGTWTGTGITNASTGQFDPSVAGAGTWNIVYELMGPCGLVSDNIDITVTVCAGCDPAWSTVSFCDSDPSFNLNTLITGDPGGTWSGTGVTGNMFNPAAGTQNITYTNALPCTDFLTQTITVFSNPTATWTLPTGLCTSSAPINLNSLITGTAGGVWSGTGVTGNMFDPSLGTQSITYAVGTAPCNAVSSQSIVVNASANASWNIPAPICEDGASINLNTLITGDPGGTWSGTGVSGNTFNPAGLVGFIAVTYTVGTPPCAATSTQGISVVDLNGNIVTNSISCNGLLDGTASANPIGGSSYSYSWNTSPVQTTQTITNLSAGNYTVVITDISGCTMSLMTTITEPQPLMLNGAAGSPCAITGSASVTATGGTGPFSYFWSPTGGTSSTANNLSAGTYNVTVTDASGCTNNVNVDVFVNTNPTLMISNDTTIDYGQTVSIAASGGASYEWLPTENLSCSFCANPIASPISTTEYCVTVTDTNGCAVTNCMKINIVYNCGEVFVPNAFSPNNIGSNELLCVYGNCVVDMVFKIYDRWGEKVFESYNKEICWDGSFRNQPMSTGVYVYIVEATLVTGETKIQTGNISLFR